VAGGSERLRFRGIVEYDGTEYSGFQVQPSVRTVQGEVESALKRVTRGCLDEQPVRVVGAGRTDAGVHSIGQVFHFDSRWCRSRFELQRALNAVLPRDIAIRELGVAPEGFHARYSAQSRNYVYSVLNRETRSPVRERFAHRVGGVIDVDAMNGAVACLVGTRDCAAFGQPPSGSVTIRTIYRALWRRTGDDLEFDVSANAFLRKMIRRLVGTLLLVGVGSLESDEFESILASKDIGRSAPPAPACGLCLVRVEYENQVGVLGKE